jgi:DNA-binding response OmpR family regulator
LASWTTLSQLAINEGTSEAAANYSRRTGVDRRVLVVDDDEGVRTGVTWALEADGFEVLAVGDGLEALDVLAEDEPLLVVLDLSLPGVGGLDILRRLRADEARRDRNRLPIIVLSGRDGETDRIVGLDLGADDYLVKPFSPGELAARARSLLRRVTDYAGAAAARLYRMAAGSRSTSSREASGLTERPWNWPQRSSICSATSATTRGERVHARNCSMPFGPVKLDGRPRPR